MLSALKEWKKASELTGGAVIPAAENWAARRSAAVKRLKTKDAVAHFIAATTIVILDPATYTEVLEFFRKEHVHLLGATVLAGLAGLRSDEIHGKRPDREPRQRWEHIDLQRKFLPVTAAKTNTQADRVVHLTPNAVAWLRLCPDREGYVCGPANECPALSHAATIRSR